MLFCKSIATIIVAIDLANKMVAFNLTKQAKKEAYHSVDFQLL